MQISEQQLHELEPGGHLFFPNASSTGETRPLKQAAIDAYQRQREEVWREISGVARNDTLAELFA